MMNEFSTGFWIGVVLMIIPFCVVCDNFLSYMKKLDSLIEQCEKDLPRSQKCVLIAIPSVLQKSPQKEVKGESK